MKKLLLSLGVVFGVSAGFSQVIFSVTAPSAISGFKEFSSNGDGSNWGLATLDGFAPLEDTVVLANDGTPGVNAQGNPASATGCNALPANSLAGKIALVFRGDGGNPGVGGCAFGLKVKNCEAAGALAVIIVNREDQMLNMDGGTDGATTNIPVVFVKFSTGMDIKNQIDGGTTVKALIGDISGFFANNISVDNTWVLRNAFGTKPLSLAQNAADFTMPVGAYIFNFGTNDQPDVALNVIVKQNGTQVYTQTSTPAGILAGDSLYFTLPDFSLATYAVGEYEVTYTAMMGANDTFPGNDMYKYTFNISDSLWSLVGLDTTANSVISKSGYYRSATLPTTASEQCMVFKDANAARVGIDGVYFGGFTISNDDTLTTSMDGFVFTWSLYAWNDPDKTITNGTFNNLIEVASGEYTYPDDASGMDEKTIFAPIQNVTSYRLANNQTYLLCAVNTLTKMYMAFSTKDHYDYNIDLDNLVRFPIRADFGTFTPAGYQSFPVPSIALRTGATLNVAENAVESSAFPVPAKDVITVKVNANGDAALSIVDMQGRQVAAQNVKIVNGQFTTSVAGIDSGKYIFTLNFDNGTSSRINVVITK
jgi:hypothetical protein